LRDARRPAAADRGDPGQDPRRQRPEPPRPRHRRDPRRRLPAAEGGRLGAVLVGAAVMSTAAELVDRLRTVTDPCSAGLGAPIDIWSLGLVEDVSVAERTARIRLVLTDASCVFFRGISEGVAAALRQLPDVDAVEVELDASILWTPDRMKDRA